MKKLIRFFTSKIKFILVIYIFIQLLLILTLQTNYKSDSLYYYKLAQQCIERNEFYPAQQHIFEDYIVAPFYVNVIIIILKIYDSTVIISLFNLIIILLELLLLYKITSKLFSVNIARLTVLLFILYLNTTGLMLQNYTELFFLLLITASIYFYILKGDSNLFLSGICLGGAIAVRPLGWALLLTLLFIQILKYFKNKKLILLYFYTYSGTLIFILLFGNFTLLHFGKFEFASTTGPLNLLLGANDDANGGFNSIVLQKGKSGYIEYPDSLTYNQKGEFYQNTAFKWIMTNPLKWISLAPLKFFHTYAWDDISVSSLLGYYNTNFLRVIRILIIEKDFDNALPESNFIRKVFYFVILIYTHVFYYFVFVIIFGGIYRLYKNKINNEAISLIILFTLFATIMIMITVGTPRYKYPMFIMLLPFAAFYLDNIFGNSNRIGEKV